MDVRKCRIDTTRSFDLTRRYRNMFSLRIGNYRAIYTLNRAERIITVHAVKHRSVVYRRPR